MFATFDAAGERGRVGRTAPRDRSRSSELMPLRDCLNELLADLRRLRLRARFALMLQHMAETIQTRSGAC